MFVSAAVFSVSVFFSLGWDPVHSQHPCSRNEEYRECANPCDTCEKRGRCNDTPRLCRPGCECKQGFLRSQGQCVPAEQCEEVLEKCPENMIYLQCGCPLTCEDPYPNEECTESCLPGCYCKQGYLMRSDDRCVPQDLCYAGDDSSKTPDRRYRCREDEEYYECTPDCKNTCKNFNNPGVRCSCGPPGCFCRKGLVKRGDGKCVPPTQCPRIPPQCPPNAVFIPCGSSCPPTCENPNIHSCEDKCVTACFCKPGYLKSKDGKRCVRPEHCNVKDIPEPLVPKCPENSVFIRCGSACPPTCEHLYPEPCTEQCVTACFCKPGYLKNRGGTRCVRPDQCEKTNPRPTIPPPTEPPATKCPENSVFIQCGSSCPPTCEYPYPDPCSEQCVPACFCKPGYLKNRGGTKCVRPDQCEKTHPRPTIPPLTEPPAPKCPENSVFIRCGSSCPPTCEHPYPDACSEQCVPACFCKPGYLKNRSGTRCVRPDQCEKTYPRPTIRPTEPPAPKCYENSVFTRCGSACPQTCERRYPDPCTEHCVTGCFCKPGYLRIKNGTRCVRPDQCERSKPTAHNLTKCTENAVYIECGTACSPTCEDPYRARCALPCVAGCFCKPGFLKRKDGRCVIPQQCEVKQIPDNKGKCREDEQYYECTPSCKNTCLNYNNPGVRCGCAPPGCFCREGLVKRADGRCVQTRHCPKTPPKCLENAVFLPCGSPCPPTCENPRPPPCSQRCDSGCFCKPGFLQTSKGNCVRPDQCNSTHTCKEGEEYIECGSACPLTCANRSRSIPCTLQCVPGCSCKQGLVKNNEGRCVSPSQCPADPVPEVIKPDRHGCPDRRACDAFCKSHGLRAGVCLGPENYECYCV